MHAATGDSEIPLHIRRSKSILKLILERGDVRINGNEDSHAPDERDFDEGHSDQSDDVEQTTPRKRAQERKGVVEARFVPDASFQIFLLQQQGALAASVSRMADSMTDIAGSDRVRKRVKRLERRFDSLESKLDRSHSEILALLLTTKSKEDGDE